MLRRVLSSPVEVLVWFLAQERPRDLVFPSRRPSPHCYPCFVIFSLSLLEANASLIVQTAAGALMKHIATVK